MWNLTATGKRIVVDPMPMDQFEKEMMAMGLPPVLVLDLKDGYSAAGEFGCESHLRWMDQVNETHTGYRLRRESQPKCQGTCENPYFLV
jgi:hypothetical protein